MMTDSATLRGLAIEDIPRTSKRLKTFEPTTLPTRMSPSFWTEAAIAVASSGSEVPSATTVSPIASSEIPKARAVSAAALTTMCAPAKRVPRPNRVSSACWNRLPPAGTNF